jgi:hypothetical protein
MVSILDIHTSGVWAKQSPNTIPNDGNGIRQDCRRKFWLSVCADVTLASSVSVHEFMDAIPYGYSLLVSAKACSRVACTCCSDEDGFRLHRRQR